MGVNEAVTPPFPNSDHWWVEKLPCGFIVILSLHPKSCVTLETDESHL